MKLHVDVRVACADDHPIVAIEQKVAIEAIRAGFDREQKAKQRGAVSDHRLRYRTMIGAIFDFAIHPVDRSGEQCAQKEGEQYPVLDLDIGGQREQIEADVFAVERIV